jgi:hypothetical protein
MKNCHAYTMTEKVFIYPSEVAAWHFVPVTTSVGRDIKAVYAAFTKGFGSLPVTVTVGKTTWTTSIFPNKYSGSYILPLKASVRKKEEIEAGEVVTYHLSINIGT